MDTAPLPVGPALSTSSDVVFVSDTADDVAGPARPAKRLRAHGADELPWAEGLGFRLVRVEGLSEEANRDAYTLVDDVFPVRTSSCAAVSSLAALSVAKKDFREKAGSLQQRSELLRLVCHV